MKIFSDFSDTIAKPLSGNKFPPFELELGKMIEQELDSDLKENFNLKYTQGYEEFLKIRRNDTIPYEKRALTWLEPFTNLLNINHIKRLTLEFDLNENFIDFTKNLANILGIEKLDITIVSGALTQIIQEFLSREDVKNRLNYIDFSILATDLNMGSDGYFTGNIKNTDELVYKGNFPDNCLIIGDDAMKNYGLGERLVNVQSYKSEEITNKIERLFR
ncbi:hypothetical protein KA062_02245 [Patescibacteria group bacterium]|nr:hypothetical protein [Patescibacteria group bacterium]